MKIIVVGLGRTGASLIEALSGENYDITVIEKEKSLVDAITDKYSVSGVVGSGASKETLKKAGAETADALVALTPVDEINLMSCMQAKALGTRRTAARLFLPDFVAERKNLQKEYNIDYIIKPKFDIAEDISRNIGLPGIVKMHGYFDNLMQMVNITVVEGSPLIGRKLMDIKRELDVDVLVSTVIRDDKLLIPDGTFAIQAGDRVGIVAGQEGMYETLQKLGVIRASSKNVLIVGGGITCEYLLELMKGKRRNITVIEGNIDKCRMLMDKYPNVKVSYGEGEVTDVLEEEHVDKMDVVVSLTDKDETNLVTSLYAWSQNVPSIITRADVPGHVKLLHRVNMDITVSPSEISVMKLIRFIRNYEVGDAQNDIGKYYLIADGKAEAMEFKADKSFRKIGMEFKNPEFKLKNNVIIASIIRDNTLIIPCGYSAILEGDRVIVATERDNHIKTLNDIFSK